MIHNLFVPEMKEANMKMDMGGGPMDLYTPDKDGSLGGVQIHNLTLGFPDLFYSGIDLYGSFSLMRYDGVEPTDSIPSNGAVGPKDADGNIIPVMSVLGRTPGEGAEYGEQYYALLIYNTPLQIFNDTFRVGFDFTYVTKNYFFYGIPDTTGHSRTLTRGKTYDAFIQIPLGIQANMTLGYLHYDIDHPYGPFFQIPNEDAGVEGGVPDLDATVQNFYFMLNAYF